MKKDDPNRGALSLYYDGQNAPKLAAKGYHELADLIVEKARENGLLLHKDKALFERLEQMEVEQSIPPTMYVVIAELIAYSYVLRGKFPDSWEKGQG